MPTTRPPRLVRYRCPAESRRRISRRSSDRTRLDEGPDYVPGNRSGTASLQNAEGEGIQPNKVALKPSITAHLIAPLTKVIRATICPLPGRIPILLIV